MILMQHQTYTVDTRKQFASTFIPATIYILLGWLLTTSRAVEGQETASLDPAVQQGRPLEGNLNEVIFVDQVKQEKRRSLQDDDIMYVQAPPGTNVDNMLRNDMMAFASAPFLREKRSHRASGKMPRKSKIASDESTGDELDSILGAIQVAHHHKLTRSDIRKLAKKAFEMAERQKIPTPETKTSKVRKEKKGDKKRKVTKEKTVKSVRDKSDSAAKGSEENTDAIPLDSLTGGGFETPGIQTSHAKKKHTTIDSPSPNTNFESVGLQQREESLNGEVFENPGLEMKKSDDSASSDSKDSSESVSNSSVTSSNVTISENTKKTELSTDDRREGLDVSTNGHPAKSDTEFATVLSQKNDTTQRLPEVREDIEETKESRKLGSMFSDEAMSGDRSKRKKLEKGKEHKGGEEAKRKSNNAIATDSTSNSPANATTDGKLNDDSRHNDVIDSRPQDNLTATSADSVGLQGEKIGLTPMQVTPSEALEKVDMSQHVEKTKYDLPTVTSDKASVKGSKKQSKKGKTKTNARHRTKTRIAKKSDVPTPDKREKIRTLEMLLSKTNPKKVPEKFLPDFPSGLRMIAWRELLKKKHSELEELKQSVNTDQLSDKHTNEQSRTEKQSAENQSSGTKINEKETSANEKTDSKTSDNVGKSSVASSEDKPVTINIEIGAGGEEGTSENNSSPRDSINGGTENAMGDAVSRIDGKKALMDDMGSDYSNEVTKDSLKFETKKALKKPGNGKDKTKTDDMNLNPDKHLQYLQKHLDDAQSLRKLIAKALVNHCETTGKRILEAFIAMDKALSRAQAIATIIGKKFNVNPDRIDNLVSEKEDEVVETFLRDIFSKFS